ncbi:MAG: glycogen synthase [Anaerolineae bacterium]|nr:glycogen synthase [Anaerolineae bacterium]
MIENTLRILFLSAEAVPFAKVGGLADVAGSLPKALRALGHDVRLMMPRYGTINSDEFGLEKIGEPFRVPAGAGKEYVHLIGATMGADVPVYLLWNEHYFTSREKVYGFEDDAQRFAVFGRGVLGALKQLKWKPDVIHANDWHTALVPTWLDVSGWRDPFFREIATLFTIHNLAYQGITGRLILRFAQMDELEHLSVEQPGAVNWMAQAIAHSDLINTVSERYAREILKPEMGMGLDPLLKQRQDRLNGVLNGLDYEEWNPVTDPHVPHNFDIDALNRRAANKTALQQQARLPVRSEVPLVGMITRLDQVKGMDLMEPVLTWLLGERDAQFVLLGTGDPRYHRMFESLQERYPDRMRAFLKFDGVLARRIYASADMFLMPSFVEPCGLGQMIAMRYGSVPVVRETGGLADTVTDHTPEQGHGTGFVFQDKTPEACQGALERALRAYQDRDTWRALQMRAMATDFSWTASAEEYVDLYHRAIAVHG